MKDSVSEKIDEVLMKVMHRYRNFFLGPGINMDEYSVPLRQRPDFVAPLVTVMGYTFGLKCVEEEKDFFIEVSGNVYASGFNIDRFKARLKDEMNHKNAGEIMKNFADEKDFEHLDGKDLIELADYFDFNPEENVRIVTKKKKEESKVTKKMEDVILQERFRVKKKHHSDIAKNPNRFESAVYLYCLRLFVSAYRKSL